MTTPRNSKLSPQTKLVPSTHAQKKTSRKKSRPKKPPGPSSGPPVRMGEALRAHGVNEDKIAKIIAIALNKLARGRSNGICKLLVDLVEKCSRWLEPPCPAGASGPPDAPVTVNLIHFASRSSRL